MTRVRNNGKLRSTSSSSTPDPALLLARGYTARHVGAVLQRHGTINPLTPQEMEHDLQHIVAYQEAAARYHQITYATTNRLLEGTNNTNSTTSSANGGSGGIIVQHAAAAAILQEPLPVKIDPDQEKRAATQRKRMQRAEAVREELEQQYVALRAHYVRTTQQLQQVQDDSLQTIEFLQRTIKNVARAMGLQRVRLQIVRDVLAALRVRNRSETSTAMQEENHPDSSPCPMAALWGQLEEDIRKVCWMQKQQNMTTTRKSSKTQSVLPWHSTKEPSTIQGVPQLVSNISTVPDKSIGITTSGTFGALSSSLLWFESHLPSPSSSALDTENAALKAEALALETELQKEREFNQRVLDNSGRARNQHDQWVAMISLVRQETEAVIHRHNVLLESDEVQKAIKEAPSTEGGEDEEEEDDDLDEGAGDEENKVVDSVPPPPPPQPTEGVDEEANEADDEGMVEDEEESETNGKRITATEEETGPRKRRKL